MSAKYFFGRLSIFGLFFIVTTIQGIQIDSNLSCQKLSTNGVCCPGRNDDCIIYESKNVTFSTRKCYCDENCVNDNYPDRSDCCFDHKKYCKTPVQTESSEKNKVDSGIKITATEKISMPEDDEDAGDWGSGDYGSGDYDDFRELLDVTKSTTTSKVTVQSSAPVTTDLYQSKILINLYNNGHGLPDLSFMKRQLHEGSTNLPKEYKISEKYLPEISGKWPDQPWAVSAAEVLSNRLSMKYKLDKPIVISTQQIISCSTSEQPKYIWTYIQQNNMVNESCYPSTHDNKECQIKFNENNLVQCKNSNIYQQTKLYKAGEMYRVINASNVMNNEANIMTEIFKYGSVQATMRIYEDFITYKNGIYYQPQYSKLLGHSSVRIIGWGEESNEKFWIAANSWGNSWGENGYFKIAKGTNACSIEYYVVGVEV